jgi:hypothetical protein
LLIELLKESHQLLKRMSSVLVPLNFEIVNRSLSRTRQRDSREDRELVTEKAGWTGKTERAGWTERTERAGWTGRREQGGQSREDSKEDRESREDGESWEDRESEEDWEDRDLGGQRVGRTGTVARTRRAGRTGRAWRTESLEDTKRALPVHIIIIQSVELDDDN